MTQRAGRRATRGRSAGAQVRRQRPFEILERRAAQVAIVGLQASKAICSGSRGSTSDSREKTCDRR